MILDFSTSAHQMLRYPDVGIFWPAWAGLQCSGRAPAGWSGELSSLQHSGTAGRSALDLTLPAHRAGQLQPNQNSSLILRTTPTTALSLMRHDFGQTTWCKYLVVAR